VAVLRRRKNTARPLLYNRVVDCYLAVRLNQGTSHCCSAISSLGTVNRLVYDSLIMVRSLLSATGVAAG
jgi:hypothetical protein